MFLKDAINHKNKRISNFSLYFAVLFLNNSAALMLHPGSVRILKKEQHTRQSKYTTLK